jgi:hypothetical protein
VRYDSAGTVIVSSAPLDHASHWTIRPRFQLGGRDSGPESFYQVTRQLVAADDADNLYVLDPAQPQLHRFGAEGRHQWSVGARGGGPGEFHRPVAVTVGAAAGAEVRDVRKGALVRFDPTGVFLAELRLPAATRRVQWTQRGYVLERWEGRDGAWAVTLAVASGSDTTEIARGRSVPPVTARLEGCGPLPSLVRPVIFAPELRWDASDSLVAVSRGRDYVIDIFDVHARLLHSIRRPIPERAATSV